MRRVGIGVGAVIALGAVLYVIGYLMTGDRAARNATVAGVAIGGQTRSDAEQELRSRLAGRTTAPIPVRIGDATEQVDPAEAGITVDYAATLDRVGFGRSLHPARIWAGITGGREVAPVMVADPTKINNTVDRLADSYDRRPRNARSPSMPTPPNPPSTPGR